MRSIVSIAAMCLFVSVPLVAQQLFVEPEFGIYKPSDEDYSFDYSPRYGGNVGMIIQSNTHVYAGYKIWSDESSVNDIDFGSVDSKNKFNTLVLGVRKHFPRAGSRYGFRVGAEYIISNAYEEDDFIDLNSLWELEGGGTGFSLEGGIVYTVNESTQVFLGMNYLKNDITIDKISVDGVSYSRQELGMSEDEATLNMDGLNLKISVLFSFGGN
jgi:hypothetical protein